MLEHYFVRPRTTDRIRALWLGTAIDRYAEWLSARQTAKSTALQHLRVLVDFNEFVATRGAQRWDELPALVEDFVHFRVDLHGKWCRTDKDRGTVKAQSRVPV